MSVRNSRWPMLGIAAQDLSRASTPSTSPISKGLNKGCPAESELRNPPMISAAPELKIMPPNQRNKTKATSLIHSPGDVVKAQPWLFVSLGLVFGFVAGLL